MLSEVLMDLFQSVMFIHALSLSIQFSCLGFMCVKILIDKPFDVGYFLRYFSIFVALQVMMFIMSWIGEEIMTNSLDVCESVYDVPWQDEGKEFGQLIQMLLIRVQKPLVLRSGAITVICRNSFVSTMKSCYTYLSLLVRLLILNEREAAALLANDVQTSTTVAS